MKVFLKFIRTFFLQWVKILPTFLSGPLLWGWVYGAPRVPIWFFPRREKVFFSGRSLTPRFLPSPALTRVYPLEDEEWFSLDTVFPVEGVEPFQELGLDYFIQQQDDNNEIQQDSSTEEDYLYGTSSGEYTDEDNPGIDDMDLFYKLETREQTYSRDDHPGPDEVESFNPRRRKKKFFGLGRITTPGEGPSSFNRQNNPLGYDGYYPQWTGWADWHLFRVSPTRITADFNWPETFYYYILFENRHTWGGDPTGDDSTLWARNARGWPVWLFRRNSRSWGPGRWRVHKEWVKRRRYNWWSKPWIKTYKKLPNGFHRRYKRFRYWYRLRELEFNPRSNRWGAPFSGRTPNPMLEPEDWAYFSNTRFLESSFFYRRRRLRERAQKLNKGRRQRWKPLAATRPRFGWARRKGFFNPRWWFTSRVGRPRPARARIAPWVAPRWSPAVERSPCRQELPPTGAGFVLPFLGVWFFSWFVWENHWSVWGFFYHSFNFDFFPSQKAWPYPPDDWDPATGGWTWWQPYTISGSFGGDYFRKTSLSLPNEWELLRGGAPRERHSTRTFGDGAYSLTWGGKWYYLKPVGKHWWSHPDIGGNLLGLSFRRAAYDTYYLFDNVIIDGLWYSQNMFGWNSGDVANLLERQIYFPYIDIFIPSWAHAHDVIGDEWVVYVPFRSWVDGGQELTTVRRIIDHRYNRNFDITFSLFKLLYKRFWPVFRSFEGFRGDVLNQYEDMQRSFFDPPEWITPTSPTQGVPQWEMAFLEGWEKVTSTQLWTSSRALRRQSVGLDVLDQVTSLDSRPRSRSEGFIYLGLPTPWEAQLNQRLLERWGTLPNLIDPQTTQMWFNSRISLVLPYFLPWWNYLFFTFFVPFGVVAFYLAAFFSLRFSSKEPLVGVEIFPIERYNPTSGMEKKNSLRTGTHENFRGVSLTRENRRLRRVGRFPAQGDPARSWRASASWRWTPEEYWSQHRLGFSRQAPRVGRRRLRGLPPFRGGSFFKIKVVSTSSFQKLSPGGGLGYNLTRFFSHRPNLFLRKEKPLTGTLFVSSFDFSPVGGNWLWRGWTPPPERKVSPPLETSYPARGRRRRPRGDDRLLTREGTWSPHRRDCPPRGDYSSEVYSPTPVTPVEGLLSSSAGKIPPTFWKLPPEWFTRSVQRQWHSHRYRKSFSLVRGETVQEQTRGVTYQGLTELGNLNFPGATLVARGVTPPAGYNTEFYSDEYFDLSEDGHQPDDGYEENHFDTLGEDYLGFRYLGTWTPPKVGETSTSVARLISYHRGETLPSGVYHSFPSGGGGNPAWGGPLWGSLGVDHPLARDPLWGGYEIPRFYRRFERWEAQSRTTLLEQDRLRRRGPRRRKEKLKPRPPRGRKFNLPSGRRTGWSTPFSLLSSSASLQDQLYRLGWSTAEGEFNFCLDDQDCLEVGQSTLVGGGYTWGGPAGLTRIQHRPTRPQGGVWSLPGGLNGWRYLVGEDLTQHNRPPGEVVFLEKLTTAYTDNYEEDAEGELGMLFDRDPEDEFFDAHNFEELDAEIPRPRVEDFPAWLLEEALGGASPGVIEPEGIYSRFGESNFTVPDGGVPGFRSSRRELRRHYRRARIKVSRWRRQQQPIHFPRRADLVNEHLRDVSPGGPDEQPLTSLETETFTGAVLDDLEAEENDELELRLWALTEIYYGDYPTGTFIDN